MIFKEDTLNNKLPVIPAALYQVNMNMMNEIEDACYMILQVPCTLLFA